MKEKVTIAICHWHMDAERGQIMRQSIESLLETASEHEIIVVDNGGSMEDSTYLLDLTNQGKIACYVRNRHDMHGYYGENQGIKLAELTSTKYIVIADNDILFKPGWLEECIEWLEGNPGKFLATPIAADPKNKHGQFWKGELGGWRLNQRAGSNVFVCRKELFDEVGLIPASTVAAITFTNTFLEKGYLVAVMPEPKAIDLGLYKGFYHRGHSRNLKYKEL